MPGEKITVNGQEIFFSAGTLGLQRQTGCQVVENTIVDPSGEVVARLDNGMVWRASGSETPEQYMAEHPEKCLPKVSEGSEVGGEVENTNIEIQNQLTKIKDSPLVNSVEIVGGVISLSLLVLAIGWVGKKARHLIDNWPVAEVNPDEVYAESYVFTNKSSAERARILLDEQMVGERFNQTLNDGLENAMPLPKQEAMSAAINQRCDDLEMIEWLKNNPETIPIETKERIMLMAAVARNPNEDVIDPINKIRKFH